MRQWELVGAISVAERGVSAGGVGVCFSSVCGTAVLLHDQ